MEVLTERLMNATRSYTKACDLVRDMVSQANSQSGPYVSEEKALCQLDAIIQTLLLNVAVEDGCFALVEEKFIRLVTEHGDAMVTINQIARQSDPSWHMTWSQLPNTTPQFQRELADYATKVLDQTAAEFAAQLAPIDSMIARDCLAELKRCIDDMLFEISYLEHFSVSKSLSKTVLAAQRALLDQKWAPYLKHTTSRPKTEPQQKPVQKPTQSASQGSNQINFKSDRLVNCMNTPALYPNAVIYIQSESKEKGKSIVSSGSGVIITRNGYALTCHHVIQGARKILVKVTEAGKSPKFVTAQVVRSDAANDVALIKLQEDTYYYAELDWDRQEPVPGESIAIYGYPYGANITGGDPAKLNVSYARGYVASNQEIGGKRRTLMDLNVRSGNSGSGITSLSNGRVVGIAFANMKWNTVATDEPFSAMTPMQYITKLINGK